MGKIKSSNTGRGYLGEIMVHKVSGQVGVVENVVEAQVGWPPELTLKLKDGTLKKGRIGDFKAANADQKKEFPQTEP